MKGVQAKKKQINEARVKDKQKWNKFYYILPRSQHPLVTTSNTKHILKKKKLNIVLKSFNLLPQNAGQGHILGEKNEVSSR